MDKKRLLVIVAISLVAIVLLSFACCESIIRLGRWEQEEEQFERSLIELRVIGSYIYQGIEYNNSPFKLQRIEDEHNPELQPRTGDWFKDLEIALFDDYEMQYSEGIEWSASCTEVVDDLGMGKWFFCDGCELCRRKFYLTEFGDKITSLRDWDCGIVKCEQCFLKEQCKVFSFPPDTSGWAWKKEYFEEQWANPPDPKDDIWFYYKRVPVGGVD